DADLVGARGGAARTDTDEVPNHLYVRRGRVEHDAEKVVADDVAPIGRRATDRDAAVRGVHDHAAQVVVEHVAVNHAGALIDLDAVLGKTPHLDAADVAVPARNMDLQPVGSADGEGSIDDDGWLIAD